MFVNGFLGAGKTSAITALCRIAAGRGLRAAVITNDQAHSLVDTATIASANIPVTEVPDGCFCCRFSDLVVAMDRLLAHDPDIVFCEAVGSCTDVVATVIRPLRRFYGDAIDIGPFAVVVDASRITELFDDEASEDLRVLRENQIAEADVILLNKIDLVEAVTSKFGAARVIPVSARSGQGLSAALDLFLGKGTTAINALTDIDYDQYARAEAMLGWMNATATSAEIVDGAALVRAAVAAIAAIAKPGESLHVKGRFGAALAQLTVAGAEPFVTGEERSAGTLSINARICADPVDLERAFERIADEQHLRIVDIQAFRPAYPRPQHRDLGVGR